MIITQTQLIDLINQQAQFVIPIYQRKYNWKETQCIKLLEDIISIAEDDTRNQHYLGAVIYKSINTTTTVGAINDYDLIDGQQRITTLMLILWAIANSGIDANITKDTILEDYLANPKRHIATGHYYKLKLTGQDDADYQALLSGSKKLTHYSNVINNYETILNSIVERKLDPQKIIKGIKKLTIANISLDVNDNPQLIFETVNSSGKKLEPVDKVRNFLLMKVDNNSRNALYTNHWDKMEQRLDIYNDHGKQLGEFLRYYAMIISEKKVPDDYYDEYRNRFFGASSQTIISAVQTMEEYSVFYKQWMDANENSKGIDEILFNIKRTSINQSVPLLLRILYNNKNNLISDSDTKSMLILVESYIVRRMLANCKTNTINEAFLKMMRNCNSIGAFKDCLKTLDGKQIMPNDGMLKNELETLDFYSLPKCRYIIDRIEKSLNPAYSSDPKLTIEHIMPQTIQPSNVLYQRSDYTPQEKADRDWAKDLGSDWQSIHMKYCNTIGNITLTGYNTELSNKRFIIKRDMQSKAQDGFIYGYSCSVIRISQSLKNYNSWGPDEIKQRKDQMVGFISKIWPYV